MLAWFWATKTETIEKKFEKINNDSLKWRTYYTIIMYVLLAEYLNTFFYDIHAVLHAVTFYVITISEI